MYKMFRLEAWKPLARVTKIITDNGDELRFSCEMKIIYDYIADYSGGWLSYEQIGTDNGMNKEEVEKIVDRLCLVKACDIWTYKYGDKIKTRFRTMPIEEVLSRCITTQKGNK